MATIRSRTNSASSASSVGSDNADVQNRGTKNVLEQGPRNKNLVQRTRDALGDIGNRLKKTGGNANVPTGKPAFTVGKPALGLQNTGSFAVPLAPPPKAVRKDANAVKKPQIFRSNSVKEGGAPQANPQPNANKPKVVKAKVFTNLHRSQSLQTKNGTAESKEDISTQIEDYRKEETSVPQEKISDPLAGAVRQDAKEAEKATVLETVLIKPVETEVKSDVINKQTVAGEGSDITAESTVSNKEKSSETESIAVDEKEDVLQIDLMEDGFSSKRFGVIDIDANDEDNYFLATQYIVDICEYLFDLEKKYPIKIRYLEGRLVNSRMRAVLMDWLVEVHNQFKFAPETLYIATKTMDRYLQIDRSITRKQLQLVGVTAMYVAAKFEEVCTPTVLDFAAVSDNAFSSTEVLKMEESMLRTLGYDLAPPPSCFFLRRFSKAASSSIQLHGLAKYIMELALVDYAAAHLFPSQQAAGGLALAMLVMEKKPLAEMWNCTMQHYSKTSIQSLVPIITIMSGVLSRAHEEPTKLQAVTNKYARARAFRVSKLPELNIEDWKPRVARELILHTQ